MIRVEEGARVGFHGINTGDRYDGVIVAVSPANPNIGEEAMGLVRPELWQWHHENGEPWVLDVTRSAKWTQWVKASDMVPTSLVREAR